MSAVDLSSTTGWCYTQLPSLSPLDSMREYIFKEVLEMHLKGDRDGVYAVDEARKAAKKLKKWPL